MADLELRKINKTYAPAGRNSQPGFAVEDIDLKVRDGEFVVLLGPSGCGKSSTLRLIAGLEKPDSGDILIDGKTVNDVPPAQRDIAMVFQNYALYPHMTVYENMAFALKQRKMPKAEIDRKVREAAQILGIEEFLSRRPASLSGGQRQRVAIGRAIVRDPKVFLMDEPLSNLDYKLRNQMRAELIRLRQKIHSTFVYVTHDQTEAVTLGDRIVIMNEGRIQQTGTPYEVFNMPENLFVAGFIGNPSMNFFDAEIRTDGGRCLIKAAGTVFELPENKAERVMKGLAPDAFSCVLGIRSDDLTVCGQDELGALCGTVEMTEMMGSSLYIHLICEGREVVVISREKDADGRLICGYEKGSSVYFRLDPSAVHLFNPQSGLNLEHIKREGGPDTEHNGHAGEPDPGKRGQSYE